MNEPHTGSHPSDGDPPEDPNTPDHASDPAAESADSPSDQPLDSQGEQAVDEAFAGQESSSPEDQVAHWQSQALRAQAELENFRKRSQREMEQQRAFANMGIVRELAPAIDNLQRAVDAAAGEQPDPLRDGVKMVVEQMIQALRSHGCRQTGAVGEPFDPNFHEAVGQEPSADHAKGTVTRVLQIGYSLQDRVIRPAHVFVSSGAPQPE